MFGIYSSDDGDNDDDCGDDISEEYGVSSE